MQTEKTRRDGDLTLTYVVASIGFGCLIGWELSGVFSPSLVLLEGYDITEAVALRIISLMTLLATFVVCLRRADWVLENKNRVLLSTAFLSLPAVAGAFINFYFFQIPLGVAALFWGAFGIAQSTVSLYWCIFFSLIPTRRTAISVGMGAVLGTALFTFINAPGIFAVSLLELAGIMVCSVVAPLALSSHMPAEWERPIGSFRHVKTLTFPAALSTGCFGAAYGFISITVCTLSPYAALIGGASGIVGTVIACVCGYLSTKVNIDRGISQRSTLPFLLGGLLLLPLFGTAGRIACCAVVISALAYQVITTVYSTCIDSYEFRLHPVQRYSMGSVPNYVGFLVGSALSFVIMVWFPLSERPLEFAMVAFSLVIVVSFVIYGADETEARKRLNKLLASAAATVAELPQQEGETDDGQTFRARCDEVAARYKLTPRESEVLRLLAKGRNAEHIARVLVLSIATVKSHIYHIYRKMDVNSQQHLMDIVDEPAEE